MILHAGPPIEWARMCGPMRGAVAGAIVLEGWAPTLEAANALAASGEIRFAPNHHFDAVGPMTGLTTRTMPVMVVENRAFGNRAYCTVNEGLGKVMRFGGNDDSVLDRLRWLSSTLGPLLGETLRAGEGVPLKALVARGLSMGDEMHQRNVACTSLLLRAIAPALARATRDNALLGELFEFIGGNDQFFLNVAMAMGKAIMDPVRGVDGASIVTAMSRNGTDFGVRLAGTGERWFTAPVEMPRGLYFPGFTANDANPDMGDSTIVETIGLGGFAMAASPAVAGFVGAGSASTALSATRSMYEITAARNPEWDDPRPGFRRSAVGHRRTQGGGERTRSDHQHRHRPPGAGGRAGGGRDRQCAARVLRAGGGGARRGDGCGMSAVVVNEVRRGFYLDSVALMRLSSEIAALPGVEDAVALIGTPSNLEIMRDAGLLAAPGEAAGPNDLVVAVRASDEPAAEAALAYAASAFKRESVQTGDARWRPRTVDGALDRMADANLVLVSTPGAYAAREARRALDRGLNVMLFSDNVSLESERALKERAHSRGLLVMGPDCRHRLHCRDAARVRERRPPRPGRGHRRIRDRTARGRGAARACRGRDLARDRSRRARSVRRGRRPQHPRRHRSPCVGCRDRSPDPRLEAARQADRAPCLRANRGGGQAVHCGRVRGGRDRNTAGGAGPGPDPQGCGRARHRMLNRPGVRCRRGGAARGSTAGAGASRAARGCSAGEP